MNKETLTAGAIGLVVGIVLTLVIAPMWGGRMGFMTKGDSMMRENNKGQNGNQMMSNIDARFIEQMIPHHESAIAMADIALQKAERPEVKQLAQDIKRTQAEEIVLMKKWYKDWYGKEVPNTSASMSHDMGGGMMMSGTMGDSMNMDKLQNSQPFDKAFLEEMIPHHQMAVMMASMLQSTSDRPEMKQLASDIIAAQNREIAQMKEWQKTWYNR